MCTRDDVWDETNVTHESKPRRYSKSTVNRNGNSAHDVDSTDTDEYNDWKDKNDLETSQNKSDKKSKSKSKSKRESESESESEIENESKSDTSDVSDANSESDENENRRKLSWDDTQVRRFFFYFKIELESCLFVMCR